MKVNLPNHSPLLRTIGNIDSPLSIDEINDIVFTRVPSILDLDLSVTQFFIFSRRRFISMANRERHDRRKEGAKRDFR
jgi:hypothetical protein